MAIDEPASQPDGQTDKPVMKRQTRSTLLTRQREIALAGGLTSVKRPSLVSGVMHRVA
jgi:hypothetical protein